MDKTIALKNAINFAKKNPNSEQAMLLRRRIESGMYNNELSEIKKQKETPIGETGIKGIATGMGKGVLSTIKGGLQLGENVGQGILGGVEKVTGLPVTSEKVYTEEALQKSAEKGGAGKLLTEETLTPQTTSEKIGKTGEQIAEFAVPSNIVSKATKTAGLIGKIIPRALTSGSVASIQSGDIGMETAIASGIETAIPVAGAILKPATKLISGLFRNIGSAMSGVPSETLQKIANNPNVANDTVKTLKEVGKDNLLRQNAKTILDGIQRIKRESSSMFSRGIESLSKTDIKPNIIKDEIKAVITNNKGSLSKTGFSLKNTEFSGDPKLVKSASGLINAINNNKDLSGRGMRKLIDLADETKLKTATSDTSISFNKFIDGLSNGIKKSISKSTNKLDKINKMYSSERQLVDAIEGILGKIKFNNEKELVSVSKRLNTAFKSSDLTESELDKFLNRIGIIPEDFKTSEAVRQISNIGAGANTMGTNRMEILRSLSGSIITPKLVRDLSIITGKTEQKIAPILEKLKVLDPTTRASIIELLLPENK